MGLGFPYRKRIFFWLVNIRTLGGYASFSERGRNTQEQRVEEKKRIREEYRENARVRVAVVELVSEYLAWI